MVIRRTKANFPFICDSFRQRVANIPNYSQAVFFFAQTIWRPMQIKCMYVFVFVVVFFVVVVVVVCLFVLE